QGGNDPDRQEALVESRQSSAGPIKRDDGAGGFRQGLRAKDAVSSIFQSRRQEGAFAQQLASDVVNAQLKNKFESRDQTNETEQVVCAGLVFFCAGTKNDPFLGDEVWAADIVPAIHRRAEEFLQGAADVHESGAAWAEQPFVSIRRQKIHMLERRGKRAKRLDGIQTKQNPPLVQCMSDGTNINALAADKMARGQRDQPRVLVHLTENICSPDDPKFRSLEPSHLDSLLRQGHPRIDVSGIIVEVDQNVVASPEPQTAGDKAQRQRSRADEG